MINQNRISEAVLVANEIHHDFLDNYHAQNQFMHAREERNWEKIFKEYDFHDKIIMEIGTGTGFVPLMFEKFNISFKKFICTDISEHLLQEAQKRLMKKSGSPRFEFRKSDGDTLPTEDSSVDIIPLNSVLPHIPDIPAFYLESHKKLTSGGILIIGHEPNKKFYNSPLLSIIFQGLSRTISLVGTIRNSLTGKIEIPAYIEAVNKEFLKRGIITMSATAEEIGSLIDYHANTGIDPCKYPNKLYVLDKFWTSDYLGTLTFAYGNIIWKVLTQWYERIMSPWYPERGFVYFAIYKKR